MKKLTGIISLLLLLSSPIFSQDTGSRQDLRPISFFIGLQPAIEAGIFDEYRNTTDVNIIPLQLEYAVNNKWSIRFSPHAFLQFKPEFPAEISRIGTGLTVPYHFSKKNFEEGHRGFYVGPHVTLSLHKLDVFTSVTGAGEIGYYFLFNGIFSVNMGVQAGRTINLDPNGSYATISNYTRAIFAFGIWF